MILVDSHRFVQMMNLTIQQQNRTFFLRTQLPNITMSLLINQTKTFGSSNMCIIFVTYPNLKGFQDVTSRKISIIFYVYWMGIDMILDGLDILYLLDDLFWEACDNSCNKCVRYAARSDQYGNFSRIFDGRKFHSEFKYDTIEIFGHFIDSLYRCYFKTSLVLSEFKG